MPAPLTLHSTQTCTSEEKAKDQEDDQKQLMGMLKNKSEEKTGMQAKAQL